MARMPGAQWRPLPSPSKSKMTAFDIICIHTMVGSLDGTDGYFRRLTNGVNSHFGTAGDGTVRQWVDTAIRSGANGNGNHHIISIENADIGPEFAKWNTGDGGAVPAFTAAQIEANAQIIAWVCRTHGIPCELIPDAKPGRRGIGYHRQGVPGFMVSGAEQWSGARGKVCPGSRRIAQIPQIITRAKAILAGAPAPVEDDMYEPTDRSIAADRHTQLANELTAQRGILLGLVGQVASSDAVDEKALAGHVSAALAPAVLAAIAPAHGITAPEVEDAVRRVFASLAATV